MVKDTAGDHEAGVQSTAGNSTKRVPGSVIEPVPEVVETIGDQVLGSSKVEPGIDWIMLAIRDAARGKEVEACRNL